MTFFQLTDEANNEDDDNLVIKEKYKKNTKESFEQIPLLTKLLAHIGFYILMLLGFMNQLIFTPKVAREKNRKVKYK